MALTAFSGGVLFTIGALSTLWIYGWWTGRIVRAPEIDRPT